MHACSNAVVFLCCNVADTDQTIPAPPSPTEAVPSRLSPVLETARSQISSPDKGRSPAASPTKLSPVSSPKKSSKPSSPTQGQQDQIPNEPESTEPVAVVTQQKDSRKSAKPPLPDRKPAVPEKPLVLPKPVLLPKPDAPMQFGMMHISLHIVVHSLSLHCHFAA